MNNPIVVGGLGSQLLVTKGYGDEAAAYSPLTPDQRIDNFTTRMKALFITQFRKDKTTPVTNHKVALKTKTTLPVLNEQINDYKDRVVGLFITQFRRNRD